MTKPNALLDAASFIADMARHIESSIAIVTGSVLEDWLSEAIKAKMRPDLPRKLSDRMFEGAGPLATFSAKIDLAYALSLVDREVWSDLRAIKDIRNRFAHSRDFLHFKSSEVAPDLQKLSGWTRDTDKLELFNSRVNACVSALKVHVQTGALVTALRSYETPGASRETRSGQSRPRRRGQPETEQ